MAGRAKKAAPTEPEGIDAEAVLATYAGWLKRQPLAARSRDAYLAQVRGLSPPSLGHEGFAPPARATLPTSSSCPVSLVHPARRR